MGPISADLLAMIISIQSDTTAATTLLAHMALRSQISSTLGLIPAKMTTLGSKLPTAIYLVG
jgi:hypothetical protein